MGALLLPVEVEARVPPGALRTPEGRLLSSLLGSGVGGSLSPGLVSTGARGGVTPQWGGKTPPRQLLCRHWQGPWPQEEDALAAGGGRPGPLWASAVLGGSGAVLSAAAQWLLS